MFSYLNKYPSAAEILAAVHGVKTQSPFKMNPEEVEKNLGEFSYDTGLAPESSDPGLQESFAFAAEMRKKMKMVN